MKVKRSTWNVDEQVPPNSGIINLGKRMKTIIDSCIEIDGMHAPAATPFNRAQQSAIQQMNLQGAVNVKR